MKYPLLSSILALLIVAPNSLLAQENERRPFTPEDVHRLRDSPRSRRNSRQSGGQPERRRAVNRI